MRRRHGRSRLAVVTAGAALPSSRQEPARHHHGSSRLIIATLAAGCRHARCRLTGVGSG